MRITLPLMVSVGMLCGCVSGGESAALLDLSDESGFLVMNNSEPAWASGEAWSVTSDPRMSIGAVDGPEHSQLYDVRAAARLSDGDVVLVDGGTRQVRLYDRAGAYLKTLGGRGSGPGEFQEPSQLMVTRHDSVLVWDDALIRSTRFNASGELVDVQTVIWGEIAKAVTPPLYPAWITLLPHGFLVVELVEKVGKDVLPGVSRAQSGALLVSEDISHIDTLMFFGDVEREAVDAPWGGRFGVEPPMAKNTLLAVQSTSPRVCFGDQATPEVRCFGPDSTRISIRWQAEPAPIEDFEIAAWRDTVALVFAGKVSEAAVQEMLEQVSVPSLRPYFTRLKLDVVGNLWVEQRPVNWTQPGEIEYLVFDPDGVLLGTVFLPPIEVLEIGEDYVLGIYRDEMDVEYLRLHAIVKPPVTDSAL